jgi:hypothetical protein
LPRITVRGVLSSWETSASLLRALTLADVARGCLEANDFAAFAEDGLRESLEPDVFPRSLADAVRHGDGPLPFERLLVGFGADAYQVLRMKEVVGVGPQQVFGLVAEEAPARGADVEVTSIRLVQADEIAHLLREQAKACFTLAQRLLGVLASRDVPRDALDGDDVASPVVDRLVALLGPDQGPVLPVPAQ